jgi:hypothetical protein
MKKIILTLTMCILINSGAGAGTLLRNTTQNNVLSETILFSTPVINDSNEFITVNVIEAASSLHEPGKPLLPAYIKVYTFPFGTTIKDVTCSIDSVQTISISKHVLLAPVPKPISSTVNLASYDAQIQYFDKQEKFEIYPDTRLSFSTGTGLKDDTHVLFLSLHYYPVTYSSNDNKLYFTPKVEFTISYESPLKNM